MSQSIIEKSLNNNSQQPSINQPSTLVIKQSIPVLQTKDPFNNNLPTGPSVVINNSDGAGPGYNFNNVGDTNTNVVRNRIFNRRKRQTGEFIF